MVEKIIDIKQIKYDHRSSHFVNTGTDYGVGKTNPVGKFKPSPKPAMPEKAFTVHDEEEAKRKVGKEI